MVSDKALVYNSKKTFDMLYVEDVERPIAQQIFGSDVETFVEAAKLIYEKMKPDIIDIKSTSMTRSGAPKTLPFLYFVLSHTTSTSGCTTVLSSQSSCTSTGDMKGKHGPLFSMTKSRSFL